MNDRRSFFQRVFGGIAAACLAPFLPKPRAEGYHSGVWLEVKDWKPSPYVGTLKAWNSKGEQWTDLYLNLDGSLRAEKRSVDAHLGAVEK